MNKKDPRKKPKTKEEIEEILAYLEKDLTNFKFEVDKKDKSIKQYVKLLKFPKIEYQKLFEENKKLIEKIE